MAHFARFAEDVPILERVATIATVINESLDDFDTGKISIGSESFSEQMLERIFAAGLLQKEQWYDVELVAVHPDNREKAIVVPLDAHQLLKSIMELGWSWNKWEALACERPPGPVGDEWCRKNVKHIEASDGLLPTINPEKIKIFTGRGSHSTAAVRIFRFAATGIHAEMCGTDGKVAMAKVIGVQPSMEEPCKRGCPYTVIKYQLVEACPRLMEVLSRTGNAGNSVYREQTQLQHCNRLHSMAAAYMKDGIKPDWDVICRRACIGMGEQFFASAKMLSHFVQQWSGGLGGQILNDLEAYERTMTFRRKLYPKDLHALGNISFIDGPKYVPALVKAMLNSPEADGSGHSTLFNHSDFASVQPTGVKRKLAKEGCDWWDSFETFLGAYGRANPHEKLKLMSSMEVRSVMTVHNKQATSRKLFASFEDIAKQSYDDAKAMDPLLPVWSKISAKITSLPAPAADELEAQLQEVCHGGLVPDNKMAALGFKVGATVKLLKIDGEDVDDTVHIVTTLPQCLTKCTLRPRGDDEADAFDISRLQLIEKWEVHKDPIVKSWTGSPFAANRADIQNNIYSGVIKGVMAEKFLTSSETQVQIFSKPNVCVRAGKAFKEGALKLYGLTSDVVITCKNPRRNAIDLGKCWEREERALSGEMKLCVYKAYAKPVLVFPMDAADAAAKSSTFKASNQNIDTEFLVAFWAVGTSQDPEKVNCEIRFLEVVVKPLDITVKVPYIVNTKHVMKDCQLFKLQRDDSDSDVGEPVAKRGKTGAKGKYKGKDKAAKDKGKGRGKGARPA